MHDVRATLRFLGRRLRRQDPYARLNRDRMKLIDFAFTRCGARSFADLGGVWAVDAGYTFYALDRHGAEAGVLVDTDVLPRVRERAARYPRLRIIEGNFGDPAVAELVGEVDTVFFFETLLHQVTPNWDGVLELYAPRARTIVVHNPQWTGGASTVRLLDLGEEEYFRNVPADPDDPTMLGPDGRPLYERLFEKLDEIHPQEGRPWRDVHNIWQWGIVDEDLVGKMQELGYSVRLSKTYGRFGSLEHFERRGFVFTR